MWSVVDQTVVAPLSQPGGPAGSQTGKGGRVAVFNMAPHKTLLPSNKNGKYKMLTKFVSVQILYFLLANDKRGKIWHSDIKLYIYDYFSFDNNVENVEF